MIYTRRGQYKIQNQDLFMLLITLFCSIFYMYSNFMGFDYWIAASLQDIFTIKGILWKVLSQITFRNPSSLISGMILMYYGRLIERRFGSCKFMNFILYIFLQSTTVEIVVFFILSWIIGYLPSAMYFVAGPYALITALYLIYLREIPLLPYASIFGLSISVHSFPFIMFVQLLEFSKPVLVTFTAGVLSFMIYGQYFENFNFLPDNLVNLFCSTANPEKILPIAATLEQQRSEVFDLYERRLIFRQMQRTHRNERASPQENQLRFLSRLLGRASNGKRAEPNEDQVRQLMDMGLGTREDVTNALLECFNDASEAANLLLQNRQ
ncbi:unnamed protein product [Thelazia callipaeda]|uniref:UBA domain-containing protein n=1 Tax=Thelazia callipaeda TaxID=103827 RepID=A0A0N5CMP0_THECL|nr:unnamed protein product [Thelazia callipaeda]